MSPQYSEKTWYFSRIIHSFFWVLIWIALFFWSFILLYWNEWRVDISEIAKESIQLDAEKIDETADWKLVSTTGKLTTDESIDDGLYLQPGKYIALERVTEMYAWVEKSRTETTTNVWWSETRTTHYDYYKEWTFSPADSSTFYEVTWHSNPGKAIESKTIKTPNAQVWIYELEIAEATLPEYEGLALSDEKIQIDQESGTWAVRFANDTYLFQWNGNLNQPQIWDIRISYRAIKNNKNVTVFWKLTGNKIGAYIHEDVKLYRVFYGSRGEAISTMKTEFKILTWVLRGVGFFLMWIGLSSILGPVNIVLDFLPIAGKISRFIIGLLSFITALILSIVTILVSIIFHNIFLLILFLWISIAGGVFYLKKRKVTQK